MIQGDLAFVSRLCVWSISVASRARFRWAAFKTIPGIKLLPRAAYQRQQQVLPLHRVQLAVVVSPVQVDLRTRRIPYERGVCPQAVHGEDRADWQQLLQDGADQVLYLRALHYVYSVV